jgi:hypothetical protein
MLFISDTVAQDQREGLREGKRREAFSPALIIYYLCVGLDYIYSNFSDSIFK